MATTIKDVAKKAGVGVGTVSRVLNGGKSVNQKTCQRVLDAIKELDFVPNKMASRLRTDESGIIALLVPIVNHPFFAKLAYYVEDEADKFGYSVLLVSSQNHIRKEDEILRRIQRREIDGAIFVTHFYHPETQFNGYPLVSIDRHLGDGIPYVTSNNYEATEQAVEYLIQKGCKKIGYIGSKPVIHSEVNKREEAYRAVMQRHGLPVCIKNDPILHGDEREIVSAFLDEFQDVDGVFASGYSMAQVLYETAQQRNIDIPGDLQIVSYDGAFRQWNNNRLLTCVEQPIEDMARAVVQLLIDKIAGKEVPEIMTLPTKFVVGATTK